MAQLSKLGIGMRKYWHYIVLSILPVPALCVVAELCLGEEGRYRLFGSEVGFARVDSHTFVFLRDMSHRFEFPFDTIMFFTAVIFAAIALAVTAYHFFTRRTDA
jgi:hypothetical protein